MIDFHEFVELTLEELKHRCNRLEGEGYAIVSVSVTDLYDDNRPETRMKHFGSGRPGGHYPKIPSLVNGVITLRKN